MRTLKTVLSLSSTSSGKKIEPSKASTSMTTASTKKKANTNKKKNKNKFSNKNNKYKRRISPKNRLNTTANAAGTTASDSPTNSTTVTTADTTSSSSASYTAHEKFEAKMNELVQRDKRGGNLTQAYCDSMLGLCVSSDEWDSVLIVLDIMKRNNITHERSSYRACLQACFEVGNGESALEILTAMQTALVEPTTQEIALAVAAMCRNEHRTRSRPTNTKTDNDSSSKSKDGGKGKEQPGVIWWKRAISLIQSTSTKLKGHNPSNLLPVEDYDAVFACMVEDRAWKDALRLLRRMEESQTNPTKVGYHPPPELSTYRTVIECCLAASQVEQAYQILNAMTEKGLKPTVYSFELVIKALSQKLQWRRAIQLLDTMEELDIPKTLAEYNSVISACARAREVGTAKNLLVRMRKEGIQPNVWSFNSVISACASTSRWKDALTVLDQCHREPGVTPDIYTYTNAMRACAKGGLTNRALNLLKVVKDKKLPIDSYCYTAVIDACAKAGMWKKALALLAEMKQQGIEPTEVTYSVVISACGNGGQWEKALELLQSMRERSMSVNLITYNAAITALSKASRFRASKRQKQQSHTYALDKDDEELWTRAMFLLEQMKEDGLEPDGFSFSAAISCCGSEGRWQEALQLMKVMKKGGPRTRPNKVAYTAAIAACGRAGEADTALDLFRSMKDEGLSADRVAYNALFSALRVAGRADQAYELWGEICGTRSTNTTAIATARHTAKPDIITVTDCIATLSRAQHLKQLDEVFEEAAKRGIVLRQDSLDSQWETDLSGMSFPVARAACRFIIRRAQTVVLQDSGADDITFITGFGRAHQDERPQHKRTKKGAMRADSTNTGNDNANEARTSLRDYAQEVLKADFQPPIESSVPQMAKGTVVVSKESFQRWVDEQPCP